MTYDVTWEDTRQVIRVRVDGGDRRDFGEEKRVPFVFAYGTPGGVDHATTKSIFAQSATGPHQLISDFAPFVLHYTPPIRLLPASFSFGDTWAWDGKLGWRGQTHASPATVTVDGAETLTLATGDVDAVHTIENHPAHKLEVHRWFAVGMGLVQITVFENGKEVARAVATAR